MDKYNILWTGGWDSTYRVLDLVLNKKKTIQPYYVLDSGRPSTEMELKTMDKIKGLISEIDQSAKEKILDTISIKLESIPRNTHITNMFNAVLKNNFVGSQYDWLARYADSIGINNLELCIHQDDKAHLAIQHEVEEVSLSGDGYFRMKDVPSRPELNLFSYFHYPILEITKLDMEKVAQKNGYSHIMEETWFCHSPYKGKPCGMCNPCKYTKEEGLGRRVPDPALTLRVKKMARRIRNKVFN